MNEITLNLLVSYCKDDVQMDIDVGSNVSLDAGAPAMRNSQAVSTTVRPLNLGSVSTVPGEGALLAGVNRSDESIKIHLDSTGGDGTGDGGSDEPYIGQGAELTVKPREAVLVRMSENDAVPVVVKDAGSGVIYFDYLLMSDE